jgi:hypothetical protein
MSAYYIAETGMLFTDRDIYAVIVDIIRLRLTYHDLLVLRPYSTFVRSTVRARFFLIYLNSRVQYVVAALVPLRDGRRLMLSTSSL